MPLPITRFSLSGLFYAVALTLFTGASAEPSPLTRSEIDTLERQTRAAYEGTDFERFERLYDSLCDFYRGSGHLQELAWTHLNFGFEAEGQFVERQILDTLRFESPLPGERRLADYSARVKLVEYRNGFRAVIVGPDLRFFNAFLPASMDPRRYAVDVYQIDRAAGFNLVPVAALVEQGNELYLRRAYADHLLEYSHDHTHQPYVDEQLHALDYLSEQLDRNRGGVGVRPGGYPVAFDNRRAMGFRTSDLVDGERLVPAQFPPTSLSEETRTKIKRLGRRIDAKVANRFSYWFPWEIDALKRKIEVLLALPIAEPAPASKSPAPTKMDNCEDEFDLA